MKPSRFGRLAAAAALLFGATAAFATTTPQTLPFTQNWTDTSLISGSDNWSGVPGITGYLGGDVGVSTTGVDPQTVTLAATIIDVNANQTNPNTFTQGGVTEFHITDPVVAMQGSSAAGAPNLVIYLDTTGATNIGVQYNVRDIDGSTDNAIQPVALQYRVGNSGAFINIPAAFIADATTGPSLATKVTSVCVNLPTAAENQPEVQLRIITTNAVGNDELVGIDDISITANSSSCPTPPTGVGAATPSSVLPGGTTLLTVTVTPGTNPTSTGIAVSANLTSIGGSATQTFFDNATNGDVTAGDNVFSYSATVSNATTSGGKTLATTITDAQARSSNASISLSVTNPPTPIHDIQGSGVASPLAGQSVTTEGIVTALRNNGFFIQAADADMDSDVNTSEGVFVFTSSAPPAAAAVGNRVSVTATVSEFVPPSDLDSVPLTELVSPSVAGISTGNALPTPVTLTAADTVAGGAVEQLEKYEGMRVTIAEFTTVAPSAGSITEPSASVFANGVLYGVVSGVARPFREPGISVLDPVPNSPTLAVPPPNVPRFDENSERLRVDTDGQTGATLYDIPTGSVFTDLTGVLDYAFRTYSLLPDPGITAPTVARAIDPLPAPTADQVVVANFNLQRYFDDQNDPAIGEPVLTAAAYQMRLNKASLAIRTILNTPDVLGVEEVENLSTLQTLAARINDDAVAASQPNPAYQAHLVEGNDVGGIDVGFLVKSSRVSVVSVTQYGKAATYLNPATNAQDMLNDRPPLALVARVGSGSNAYNFTVVVNHLRSLGSVDDAVDGPRVRAKRAAQAEYLANLIQGFQTAEPTRHIMVIGDMNAFEVNDGYVDGIGTILGTPTPEDQVVVASPDLVNPNFTDRILDLAPGVRYSYTHDGIAQVLDHIITSESMATTPMSLVVAHLGSDYPTSLYSDETRPERLSDHDAPVLYISISPVASSITPASGPANTAATVAGAAFANDATVTIGGQTATNINVASSTSITLNTPTLPAGTLNDVVVTNSSTGLSSTLVKAFFSDYNDVHSNNPFYSFIVEIARLGITLGCRPGEYCPTDLVLREQSAAFISRAMAGSDQAVPASGTVNGTAYSCGPNGTSLFADVAATATFCRHIHYVANAGVTLGCAADPVRFCPAGVTTRAAMAAFISRALVGGDANVPATVALQNGGINQWGLPRSYDCTDGLANAFSDIPDSHTFCRQVHYLWARGIVDGFGNGIFGPNGLVNREQMAKFLANAF